MLTKGGTSMEEIKKDAERFAEFLDYAEKYLFTKEALMNTGFFSCEEEMEVFFSQYDEKYYETKTNAEKFSQYLFDFVCGKIDTLE